jgi:hypothetical protein
MRPRPARRASLSLARHWIAHQAGNRFVSYVSRVSQLKHLSRLNRVDIGLLIHQCLMV